MDLKDIQKHFRLDRIYYSAHAVFEMKNDSYGEIKDEQVAEAAFSGEILMEYPEDKPCPSLLIFGKTRAGRPLHLVCACNPEENLTIIITVYHPDPEKWIGYRRRKKP